MRIFDIVAEPLRELADLSKEEIRQRVLNTIRAVGLEEAHLQRFPHAFSGVSDNALPWPEHLYWSPN